MGARKGEDLFDDDRLPLAVDAMARKDNRLRRLSKAVLRHQSKLRKLLSDEQWEAYLELEEAANSRAGTVLLVATKWAFETGRRCKRRRCKCTR